MRENTRRGDAGLQTKLAAEKQTHCRNGHERKPENTYVRKDGRKQCKVCALGNDQARRSANLRSGLTRDGAPRQRAVFRRHREAFND